jgi:hypothetical protein
MVAAVCFATLTSKAAQTRTNPNGILNECQIANALTDNGTRAHMAE